MDLTSGIITLVPTGTVIGYLRDINDSSSDRKTLLDELSMAHYLLLQLKDNAQGDPHTWSETIRSLAITGGPIDQFNKTIKIIKSKLEVGSGIKKIGQALKWPFQKAEVQSLISTLERQKSFFNIALQNDHRSLTRAIKDDIEELNRKIDDWKLGQHYQENRIRDEESREIVDWLSSLDFWATQNDNFERHQKGTGEWMLNDANFRKWVEGDVKVLWCPGDHDYGVASPFDPAKGFRSIVINYLQKQYMQHDKVAVVFVYFNYKEPHPVNEILGSLLKQLTLRKTIISPAIRKLWQLHTMRKSRPTDSELLSLLQEESKNWKLFVVIDALDECPETHGDRDCRQKLLLDVGELGPQLFVTGRPHVKHVVDIFPDAAHTRIRASDDDVRKYVNGRIDMDGKLRFYVGQNAKLRRRIVSKIVKKVDGMFLMAELHMGALARKHNLTSILAALEALPDRLHDTYDDVMDRIVGQGGEEVGLAMATLTWVVYAREKLTPKQIEHAVATTSELKKLSKYDLTHVDHLILLCCGIVTEDKESGTVRLVHYTTQEYFERTGSKWFPDAQNFIVTTCLKYITLASAGKIYSSMTGEPEGIDEAGLLCSDDESSENAGEDLDERKQHTDSVEYPPLEAIDELENESERAPRANRDGSDESTQLRDYPLLDYAIHFWGVHAQDDAISGITQNSVLEFLEDEANRKYWVRTLEAYYPTRIAFEITKIPATCVAAIFGLEEIVGRLLQSGGSVSDISLPYKETPLHWATLFGHVSVVRKLLSNGADVEARSDDWTALHIAAVFDYVDIAQTLLQNGADVNATSSNEHWKEVTAMSLAKYNGSVKVEEVLLKHGFVGTSESEGWSTWTYGGLGNRFRRRVFGR